ncbi:hypothetical protein M409DRAFT_19542 [Zasmidium cellare ATCC 36951]|uniref:SnoaL-like domain-containing protein n=1 Tax=Zasmidium cellare ATCC 36951 TaxID=1080233 RepID=A0A6A6CRZ2_ZASCE|nr:uncharacterized protein M409DRAFT_19542 [Zasmidium cellare ATCC 36951]KAF2169924.1 hypothetical protein M409DRAFT_19542 [Zasmidium cellare ATCC 36951]
MSPSPNKAAILRLLSNTTDLSTVREIVAPGATYVSLAFENPDLKAIEPWCGIHKNVGPEGVHEVFVQVNRAWEVEVFDIHTALADGETKEVAVFGRFRFVSRGLGKVTDSPFAVLARFGRDGEEEGKVVYMQFLEDTLSTAGSLR